MPLPELDVPIEAEPASYLDEPWFWVRTAAHVIGIVAAIALLIVLRRKRRSN